MSSESARHVPESTKHIDETSTVHRAAKTIFLDKHGGRLPSGNDYWTLGTPEFILPNHDYGNLTDIPFLGYLYHEPWAIGRGGKASQTVGALFGIEDPDFSRVPRQTWFKAAEGLDFVGKFPVLDVDSDRIEDPVSPGASILPGRIKTAQSQTEAAALGTWVANQHDRHRISEYAQLARERGRTAIDRYVALRDAASDVKSKGRFEAYKAIRRHALMTDHQLVDKGIREYTPEDLEWLEEHMRAQGIPIPGSED
jgi:hypothetical protein